MYIYTLYTCLVFEDPFSHFVRVGELGSEGDLLDALGAKLDKLGARYICPVEGNLTRNKESRNL